MLNILWGILMLLGIAVGVIDGSSAEMSTGLLDGAKEAVSLCITMLGIMAFWTGLMEIASQSGLMASLTNQLKGILHILFPDLPKGHVVQEYIAANMLANMLGLGWAATPMGIRAMKELAELDTQRHGGHPTGIASVDMCTFLIINVSSLQLIPVTVIAYRSQYGSVNPSSIIGPALIATFCSTAAGVVFSLIARKFVKNKTCKHAQRH